MFLYVVIHYKYNAKVKDVPINVWRSTYLSRYLDVNLISNQLSIKFYRRILNLRTHKISFLLVCVTKAKTSETELLIIQ